MPDLLPCAPATAAQLLAVTARAQRDGRLPSLVAGVARDGGLAWSAGRGQVEGAEPDADVQYRIGSITKTLTAVLVLRLRDEGRLALDDPLDRLLPGTPYGGRTVGQLLSHVGGLRAESPGDWWERSPGAGWDALGAGLGPADLRHGAGRRFHYSNLGYGVLGELVARLRGRPWADVVATEVLGPLGMTRTTPRPAGRAARGYAVHPWADVVLPEPEHDAGAMAPAGQLWSTATDLARVAAFLLGDTGDVLDPATLAEMAEPAGVDLSRPGTSAYGLGLQVVRGADGRTLLGHGGSMPGFLAGVFVDRDEECGAVVLANATSGLDPALTTRLLDVVRAHEPRVVEPWRAAADGDDAALELAGVWYWGPAPFGLRLEADGGARLLPLGGPGRSSRFRRDAAGRWVGLDGYYAGEELRAVRGPDGGVVSLDLGTFVLTRTPYDPAAPVPGGVDPQGWRPGPL